MPVDEAVGALVDLGDDGTSFVVDPSSAAGSSCTGAHRLTRPRCDRRRAGDGARRSVRPRRRRPGDARARARSGFPGRPGLSGRRGDGGVGAALHCRLGRRPATIGVSIESARRRRRPAPAHRRSTRHPGGADAHRGDADQRGRRRYWLDDLAITLALPAHVSRAADVPRPVVPRVPSAAAVVRRRPVPRREPPRPDVAREPAAAVGRHEPASASNAARCGARTWRGAATPECTRRAAARRARRCCSSASCCTPARSCSAPGESTRRRRCTPSTRRPGSARRAASSTPSCDRRRRTAPTPRPVRAQHVGGGVLRPRLRHARPPRRARRDGRRRALRARRRVVRRPPRRHAPASATGGCRPTPTRRAGAADRPGSAALGMEFGIWVEPEMVNPDSDLYRAHPDWALADPGYEPVLGRHQLVLDLARTRGLRGDPRPPRRAARRPRHRVRQVGHEPRPRAGQRRRRAGRAPTPRRSPCTGCSTSCAGATPTSSSRAARRVAPASTSGSSSAPSGCGRATATTPSSARRSSATPRR